MWTPGLRYVPGLAFSAKPLLEVAVMLLGASISFATLIAIGPSLLAGIAGVVCVAIVASYAICRALGLPRRMSVLIACGNSICGNSAIAAIAPIIRADGEDVAASIAFTAVLGILVVLGLPLLVPVLGLSEPRYGTLAGLTVYAVPQVLAATVPIGALSNQVGTLVKLVRVLMLGPVVLFLSLFASPLYEESSRTSPAVAVWTTPTPARVAVHQLVPWFILGFVALAALRSAGLIPDTLLIPIAATTNALTSVSMAALGLRVDVRVVAKAGGRVTVAVTLSLIVLCAISLGLIYALHVV